MMARVMMLMVAATLLVLSVVVMAIPSRGGNWAAGREACWGRQRNLPQQNKQVIVVALVAVEAKVTTAGRRRGGTARGHALVAVWEGEKKKCGTVKRFAASLSPHTHTKKVRGKRACYAPCF